MGKVKVSTIKIDSPVTLCSVNHAAEKTGYSRTSIINWIKASDVLGWHLEGLGWLVSLGDVQQHAETFRKRGPKNDSGH